jgi:hypothetical protein
VAYIYRTKTAASSTHPPTPLAGLPLFFVVLMHAKGHKPFDSHGVKKWELNPPLPPRSVDWLFLDDWRAGLKFLALVPVVAVRKPAPFSRSLFGPCPLGEKQRIALRYIRARRYTAIAKARAVASLPHEKRSVLPGRDPVKRAGRATRQRQACSNWSTSTYSVSLDSRICCCFFMQICSSIQPGDFIIIEAIVGTAVRPSKTSFVSWHEGEFFSRWAPCIRRRQDMCGGRRGQRSNLMRRKRILVDEFQGPSNTR